MPKDRTHARAMGLAYRYLTMRARSRAELSGYLKKKEVPDDVAGRVLEELESSGYVDDRKFAFDYSRYLVEYRNLSRYALMSELRRKGVSADDAGPALDELFGDEGVDEYDVALRAARKKADSLSGLTDRAKARRRLTDFLRRRGFSFDVIRKALSETGFR